MSIELSQLPGGGLLDWKAAAAFLGISERHVHKLYEDRRLPAVRVGKLVRFDPADLVAFIDANRIPVTR